MSTHKNTREEIETKDIFSNIDKNTVHKESDHWGDKLIKKSESHLRLYFQNIHGLKTDDLLTDWNDVLSHMKANEIDVFGMAETNIDWNPSIRNKLYAQLRQHMECTGNKVKLLATSSDEPTIGIKQYGGVAMVTHGDIVGRIGRSGNDEHGLGRWVYMTIQGKEGRKVVVVTLYRLSQNRPTEGQHTAYNQQYRILRQRGETKPEPQKRVCQDLLYHIKEWRKDSEVIVMADANANLTDNDWANFMNNGELYDILGTQHGHNTPKTYIRGSNTIDFILGTKGIMKTVAKTGMLPFNWGILSDHRGLWVDLDVSQLLKGTIPRTEATRILRPKTKQKKRCAEMRKHVAAELRINDVQNLLGDLKERIRTETPKKIMGELNAVDDIISEALLSAINLGKQQWPFWWSPEIHYNYIVVKIWKLKRTEATLGIEMEAQINHLKDLLPKDYDTNMDNKEMTIKSQIRRATKLLRKTRAESFTIRQDFLKDKIDPQENTKGKKGNKIRTKIIMTSEQQSKIHMKIARYLKPNQRQGLTHVDVEKEDGNHRIVLKEEVEDELFNHHRKHFSQATGTRFTDEDAVRIFGFNTETETSRAFRSGEIDPKTLHTTDEYANKYLDHITPKTSDPTRINDVIKVEEVERGFRIWKEKTSTSPKGRILTLYKMWLNVNEERAVEEGSMTGREFMQIITDVINLSQTCGEPLTRWKTVHNLFILKEPNNFKIHRLRALHKIDAELNLVRRELITRRLLRQAERQNFLDDNSYGGRNGRCANDAVMKKFMTLQTMHLERRNGAMTDCDAKACYDRIVPIVLYLSYSKAGLPHTACVWLCKSLTKMQYHMTTAQGVSERHTENTSDCQIYGVGQGATDAPTGWLFVSTTISRLQDKYATGCVMRDPTRTITVCWTHVIFVDDTYLMHTLEDPTATEKQIAKVVEQDVNLWNKGIETTGGRLEGTKTKFYTLIWKFKSTGEPYLDNNDESDLNVRIISEGKPIQLNQIRNDIEPNKFKSLGTMVPGTLSDHYELEAAKTKIRLFTKFLTACPLTRYEAWVAYKQYFLPSILYGSVITSFSRKQCVQLHAMLIPRLLQKLGYKSTFPRELVFAPKSSGGLGIVDFSVGIAQAKILCIIRHVRANTSIGNLFLIALRWAQIQAGTSRHILTTNRPMPHVESDWFLQLRSVLWTINGAIWIKKSWRQKPQRDNDIFLMDFILNQNLTDKEIRELNYCRLYMRVTRLSDIATTDGMKIQEEYCIGEKRNLSKLDWPNQNKPSQKQFDLWTTTLKRLCKYNLTLIQPLGRWYKLTDNRLEWFYDDTSKIIYQHNTKTWKQYQPLIRRTSTVIQVTEFSDIPRPMIPLTPIVDMQLTTMTGRCTICRKERIEKKTTAWNEDITIRGEKAMELKEVHEVKTIIPAITAFQLNKTIWLVTDGGVSDSIGYFGWVIATDTTILFEGKGSVQGNDEEMDSTRAESGALMEALIYLTKLYQQRTLIQAPTIRHFCDNMVVTERMRNYIFYKAWYPNQTTKPHMDIQLQICELLDNLSPRWTTSHVKGHQDKNKNQYLSWEATLNVRADALATLAKEDLLDKYIYPKPVAYPASEINLFIDDKIITKAHGTALTRAFTTGDLRTYITAKFKWEEDVCDTLDWFGFGRGFQKLPSTQQRWATKFTHQWLPLLGEAHTQTVSNQCPVCNEKEETWIHFLECEHNKHGLTKIADKVTKVLTTNKLDPNLKILIRRALLHISNSQKDLERLGFPYEDYADLIKEQEKIGWKRLHHARMGLLWDRYQRRYLLDKNINISKSEPPWIQQMVYTILSGHHKRWLQRNDCLHNSDKGNERWENKLLLQRIQHQYQLRDKMLNDDQLCFSKDVSFWTTAPTSELKYWLKVNVPHIKKCLSHAVKQMKEFTSDIRAYGFNGHTSCDPTQRHKRRQMRQTKNKDKNLKIGERMTAFISRRVTYRSATGQPTEANINVDDTIQQDIGKFFKVSTASTINEGMKDSTTGKYHDTTETIDYCALTDLDNRLITEVQEEPPIRGTKKWEEDMDVASKTNNTKTIKRNGQGQQDIRGYACREPYMETKGKKGQMKEGNVQRNYQPEVIGSGDEGHESIDDVKFRQNTRNGQSWHDLPLHRVYNYQEPADSPPWDENVLLDPSVPSYQGNERQWSSRQSQYHESSVPEVQKLDRPLRKCIATGKEHQDRNRCHPQRTSPLEISSHQSATELDARGYPRCEPSSCQIRSSENTEHPYSHDRPEGHHGTREGYTHYDDLQAKRKSLLCLPKKHPSGRIAPNECAVTGNKIVQKERNNKGNKRTSKEMRKNGETKIKSKNINLTPVGIVRTHRNDIDTRRTNYTRDQDCEASTRGKYNRTGTTEISKNNMTNMSTEENEIVPETDNDDRQSKPQHKTETYEDDGRTREQKTGKSKRENKKNGRQSKIDNLLKGIRNHGKITTKEIKREKIEYMQKYPP